MTSDNHLTVSDGRRLAFATFGDPSGTPVLFFHGGNDSRLAGALLDDTARALSVRLIAPDRPGFGRSDHLPGRRLSDWPTDVAALADHLGVAEFALLGHSGGGPHALACAAALPDRVRRAAVVSSPAPPPASSRGLHPAFRVVNLMMSRPGIYRRLAASQARQLRANPDRWLGVWKRMQPADGRMFDRDPHIARVVVDEMTEALTAGIDGITHEASLYHRDWGFRVRDITVPVDVWHGSADRQAAPGWSEHLASELPHADLHLVDGLGHFSVLVDTQERILNRVTSEPAMPARPHGVDRARRPTWLPTVVFPFDARTVDVAGNGVCYVDEGAGPPLLFIHGNPDYSLLWRRQIRGLRDRHRCVALDLPGFGRSRARFGYGFTPAEHTDVVRGFVEALDLRELTLIAHDWGGPIGLRAAADDRDRYTRLVIAGIPVGADYRRRQPLWVRAMMAALAGRRGKRFVLSNNLILEGPLRGEMRKGPDPVDDRTANAYRGPFPTPASRLPTWVLAHYLWTDAGDAFLAAVDRDLARLAHLPALLLYAADDRFTSPNREVPRLRDLLTTHDAAVIAAAGHFFPESAPDATTAAIRTWLDDTPAIRRETP